MTSILYFALSALLFFVLMRFGCGAHVMGHGSRHRHDGGARDLPEKATDPVCGMDVEPKTAKTSVHDGRTYYFCSTNCREKFEAAPNSYTKGGASRPAPMETHHGPH